MDTFRAIINTVFSVLYSILGLFDFLKNKKNKSENEKNDKEKKVKDEKIDEAVKDKKLKDLNDLAGWKD